MARNARMIHVQTPHELNKNWPIERFLEALINVANRCIGTTDTTVVNMSWGMQLAAANVKVWLIMGKNYVLPTGNSILYADYCAAQRHL